jgi:hypothetical protein
MDSSKIIDSLGGTSKVADLCDITTGAVSQWRTNGIPKPWLALFKTIRPELFSESSCSDTHVHDVHPAP